MRAFRLTSAFTRPLLAALVMLSLLIPTLDSFRCVGDVAQGTAAFAIQKAEKVAAATDISGNTQDADQDSDSLCLHGHCHYPPGMTRVVEIPNTPTAIAYFEPFRGTDEAPPARPPLGLLRPPRA